MKTIEEKAREYAETAFAKALKAPWNEAKQAFADAYLAGVNEALAGQWRRVEDELPEESEHVLIETINTIETAFWNPYHQCWDDPDGDDILYEKDKVIRWMRIPEPPKDESNV